MPDPGAHERVIRVRPARSPIVRSCRNECVYLEDAYAQLGILMHDAMINVAGALWSNVYSTYA
jgi:hypothetical protein